MNFLGLFRYMLVRVKLKGFSLFQDPVMRHGWRTGAILPELEVLGTHIYFLLSRDRLLNHNSSLFKEIDWAILRSRYK